MVHWAVFIPTVTRMISMRRILYGIVFFMMAAGLCCCQVGEKKKSSRRSGISLLTPSASGRAYELLVVVDEDLWERPAGRALDSVLDTDVPGLPQSERCFRVMHVAPRAYDATMKLVRNIIMVDIQNIYTQTKLKSTQNVYSYPQSILTIQAPDEASFEEFVGRMGQTIIDYFNHAELNRQIGVLETSHSSMVRETVREMFGYDVWVPAELKSAKRGEDFFWAGTNAATRDMNYVIYSYPYTEINVFTKEGFVAKRDSFMRENIPGSREGMYMATDSLFTNVKSFRNNGEYVFEARGLWKIKGDMMGGPYVSQARVDEVNQRVVVQEIFIYSPDTSKRNLVYQMEASLYTLQMPSKDNETKVETPEVEPE